MNRLVVIHVHYLEERSCAQSSSLEAASTFVFAGYDFGPLAPGEGSVDGARDRHASIDDQQVDVDSGSGCGMFVCMRLLP